MKGLIFLFIFSGLLACGCSEKNKKDNEEKLSVSQMQEDIDFFFTTQKNVHPRLYYKYTEAQIDSVQQAIKEKCRKPLTATQFHYTIIQANKYMDNHSKLFMNYDKSVSGVTSWIDFTEKEMRLGDSIIEEINGTPAHEIAAIMENIVTWDFPPNVRSLLKNSNLPHMLSGYYGFKFPYTVKLNDPKTKRSIKHIMDRVGYSHFQNSNYDPLYHKQPYAQQTYEKESIGVFYFNTSEFYESADGVETVKKRLGDITSDFFTKVKNKKIKNVFIDVSQNGGGSIYANNYLMKYLDCKPYTAYYTSYVKPKGAEIFAEQTKTEEGLEEVRKKMFEIATKEQSIDTVIVDGNKNGYKGNVYIIMGDWSVSAAFNFCEGVKLAQAGILVGEVPSQHSPYAGNTLLFKLPNSGIGFSCGSKLTEIKPDVTNGSGFLQPDIPYKLDHPLSLNDYKQIISLKENIDI